MNNPHILIDLNEASDVVIKFIGTDKFNEIVSSLEDNAKAGFIAGMSFALCLANVNCKKFLYHIEEQKIEDK